MYREYSNSQERVGNRAHRLAPNFNSEHVTQPSAIEKLAFEFSDPTTSSEAAAINSIWMILKTLQPKRKDALPLGNKFVKEYQNKRNDDKLIALGVQKGNSAMKIHNELKFQQESMQIQTTEGDQDIDDLMLERRPRQDLNAYSHKRASSQAMKTSKDQW